MAGPAVTPAMAAAYPGSELPLCSTYPTGPRKAATVTTSPSAVRTREIVTCGVAGFGVGAGFGAGLAAVVRGCADAAALVPASLLTAGAAAGAAVHAVARKASETSAPATMIDRTRKIINGGCDGGMKTAGRLVAWHSASSIASHVDQHRDPDRLGPDRPVGRRARRTGERGGGRSPAASAA